MGDCGLCGEAEQRKVFARRNKETWKVDPGIFLKNFSGEGLGAREHESKLLTSFLHKSSHVEADRQSNVNF